MALLSEGSSWTRFGPTSDNEFIAGNTYVRQISLINHDASVKSIELESDGVVIMTVFLDGTDLPNNAVLLDFGSPGLKMFNLGVGSIGLDCTCTVFHTQAKHR